MMNNVDGLITAYRDSLLNDTLPFWLSHGVDREHGGFLTCLNRDGSLVDTDKGVWQQGRATWLFGELYNNVEKRPEWLELARSGARFMDDYCFDRIDGRMWFHVTADGQPIRKRRYSFSESFAAIAYGELARATQDDHYADRAERCFRQFLDHHQTPNNDQPKYTSVRPTRSLSLPMIAIVTAQELRESIELADADATIERSINEIQKFHVNEDLQCVLETTGTEGEFQDHFDGRILNPGHAIEAAWFIMREGKHRQDPSFIRTGCQMLDWAWEKGWDNEFGGLLYFVDARGLPVQEYWHDMKFWWPHCEAIIATLLAFQLTGDARYQRWHAMVHDWSQSHFPDPEHGEWFGYLHRDGTVSSTLKGNLWKGPFHIPRMQLIAWQILEEISAASV